MTKNKWVVEMLPLGEMKLPKDWIQEQLLLGGLALAAVERGIAGELSHEESVDVMQSALF